MHSRETVVYVRRRYQRGDQRSEYYYKRELLTSDSYRNLDSLYWSAERPITRQTYERAAQDGYHCEAFTIYMPPIELIELSERRERRERNRADEVGDGHPKRRATVVGLLRRRLRKSMGM